MHVSEHRTTFGQVRLLIAFCAVAVAFAGCDAGGSGVDPAKQKAFATELLNRELYADAAAAFDRYVEMPGVSDDERGKALYAVANALFDNAKDYDAALVRYLRIRSYYPDFRHRREVDAKIVRCFELTGRSLEAQLALEQAADLNRQQSSGSDTSGPGGTVVAEIGSRTVHERDVVRRLQQLPPEMRGQFESPQGKREFLRHIVGLELLYDSAVRRGLNADPEIERRLDEARRDLMVQKLVEEHLQTQPPISETEVRLYYQAHADRFRPEGQSPLPLDAVRDQVEQEVRQEKRQDALNGLIERALHAQEVRLYPERLR